jgi:hypothetical protein
MRVHGCRTASTFERQHAQLYGSYLGGCGREEGRQREERRERQPRRRACGCADVRASSLLQPESSSSFHQ